MTSEHERGTRRPFEPESGRRQSQIEYFRSIISMRLELSRVHIPAVLEEALVVAVNRHPSVGWFTGDKSWWVAVSGIRFTPAELVKTMVIRKDGNPKRQKPFSVFVADCKRFVERDFSIWPLIARNKERHQVWDEPFISAFFRRLDGPYTAYTLDPTVEKSQLMELFYQEIGMIANQYGGDGVKYFFRK